ncbi:hypothetical protein K9N68_37310 (plasmid) [Kovacikia minuta CCNUW1]|uniref:hypothetical protein n=1 Tax=Kovacikia minuta TaxID=2931930 RepID=UPI001CCE54CE|nr:hypothetical protein [Kovacikia minuta]UBF29872.1 hypothetical protein K9N68_37310 [Kovacikia minuta CCNUW1]
MPPPYPYSYEGIVAALIDKFGLIPFPMHGPPYESSFKGIVDAIQDLAGGGGGGGSGTVTGVNLTAPVSVFSVTGVPITTSGTIVLSFLDQPANTFFAGPSSGSPAAPAFREIESADLGSGSANSTTFLRGDGTWAVPSGGSGGGGLNWLEITADQTGIAGEGYIANGGSRILVTLPVSPSIGDQIGVYAANTFGWRLVQQAGQTIRFAGRSSIGGTDGYLQSQAYGDAAWLTYLGSFGGSDVWGVINHEGSLVLRGVGAPPYYSTGVRGYT